MNSNRETKNKYRQLCEEKSSIPLFLQPWWMDCVCLEKDWDVLICENGGEIVGVLVYHYRMKFGHKIVILPQLTQYNGIWIDFPLEQELHKRFSFEQKVMEDLISQLDKLNIKYYNQNFHYSFTNWQPFYWKGFEQTTKYTYQIKDICNLEPVLKNFSYAKQKHIKKENLLIDFSLSAEDFYHLHKQSLAQKNTTIAYAKELFLSIYNEAVKREQGKIIAIKDIMGNFHSALFIVWDNNSAYCLISAIDQRFKSSGASTQMFWEAMKYVSNRTRVFDFEGSMIKGVALSFQQFGAAQVPYYNISKSYSPVFSFIKRMKYGNNR